MNKKITLHIGSQKTGTTALIYFLTNNLDTLNKHGIGFPHPWFEINPAQSIFTNEFAVGRDPDLENPIDFKVPSKIVTNAYRRAINQSTATHQIFVSGRFFSHRTKTDVNRLKEYFKNYDVNIVVYLRRQDLFVEAHYRQLLKRTLPGATNFQKFIERPHLRDWLHYEESLSPWIRAFGQENVTIRPYEKGQLPNGTVQDFAEILNLPNEGNILSNLSEAQANHGLPPSMLMFLERIKQNELDPKLRMLVDSWAGTQASNSPKSLPLIFFNPEERHKFLATYAAGNKQIAENFLNREKQDLFLDQDQFSPDNSVDYNEKIYRHSADGLTNSLMTYIYESAQKSTNRKSTLNFRKLKIDFMKKIWKNTQTKTEKSR